MENSDGGKKPPASFIVGAIALVFLIVGYQSALFIRKAAVTRIISNHDNPDTVFIRQDVSDSCSDERPFASPVPERSSGLRMKQEISDKTVRKNSAHSPEAERIRLGNTERKTESFRFNPNTASLEDLTRLGFSLKQAQSIDNYRQKGGRFRRKSDFAKSYVVEDSVYYRLEPFIDIPKIDLNEGDSTTFETLPGIGKFFAGRMVSYRKELGGYSFIEQLMDIWHFDQEKFNGLKDLIVINSETTEPYPLWTLPEKELLKHPYIGKSSAHGIVLFRENSPGTDWTIENLAKAGVLDKEMAAKLSRCVIESP